MNTIVVPRRVVLLTGSELRHTFMRIAIACSDSLSVLRSYCEGLEQSLQSQLARRTDNSDLQSMHVAARQQSEHDFFAAFNRLAPDRSKPYFLAKGQINAAEHVAAINGFEPELIAAYGCSLINSSLVQEFAGRFLNLHLGLSPYYRGSGTNFWPLVNGEPEYVGATFMFLDEGVDTGQIIHQIRARVYPGDTVHQIGNRLIADAAIVYRRLLELFESVEPIAATISCEKTRYYRRKDFTSEATQKLYENFSRGMVGEYLNDHERRTARVPLVVHPQLADVCEADDLSVR